MHWNHLEILLKGRTGSVVMGFCISNKLPGKSDASGSWGNCIFSSKTLNRISCLNDLSQDKKDKDEWREKERKSYSSMKDQLDNNSNV